MTYAMESCARNNKPFVIFDRPNPLGASIVEGCPLEVDAGLIGRVFPNKTFGLPARYGMTIGELATLINEEWMSKKV